MPCRVAKAFTRWDSQGQTKISFITVNSGHTQVHTTCNGHWHFHLGTSFWEPLHLHSLLPQHRKMEDACSFKEYLSLPMVNTSRWLGFTETSIAASVAHDLPTGDTRFLRIHHNTVGHGGRWLLVPFDLVLRFGDWNRFLVRSGNFTVTLRIIGP